MRIFGISQDLMLSWLYVAITVGVALAANVIATRWAETASVNWSSQWANVWLAPMLVIAPLVFITFGMTADRLGLALGSANVDALLTVATIGVAIIFRNEWNTMSLAQKVGVAAVVIGILMTQFGKAPTPA